MPFSRLFVFQAVVQDADHTNNERIPQDRISHGMGVQGPRDIQIFVNQNRAALNAIHTGFNT